MISTHYSIPVYTRVLTFAYMHDRDWSEATRPGPKTWASNHCPRINLGPGSGKTTAIVDFCDTNPGVIVITDSDDKAANLTRKHSAVRAFSVSQLNRLGPGHFLSTQPLFVFDEVPGKDVLDVLLKFRPTRFVHVGIWG